MKVEAVFKVYSYLHQIGNRIFVKQLHSNRNFCFTVEQSMGDITLYAVDEYGVKVGPFNIPKSDLTYVLPDDQFLVRDNLDCSGIVDVLYISGIVEVLDYEEEKFALCRLVRGGPYRYIRR